MNSFNKNERDRINTLIWYQTSKNGVEMVGQNAILTSSNMFEWLSQESVSLNPFAWHSNYYLTIRMACAQC